MHVHFAAPLASFIENAVSNMTTMLPTRLYMGAYSGFEVGEGLGCAGYLRAEQDPKLSSCRRQEFQQTSFDEPSEIRQSMDHSGK